MRRIDSLGTLEALYGTPSRAARDKVADRLTPLYRRWVEASRFCILSTVGPEGTDASPRGDDGQVVRVADARTLMLPDWRGNERIDSLRNIVADGRVSLMFMVPGSANVVRANGRAWITDDAGVRSSFDRAGRQPRSVTVVEISEVYFQCARAIVRARLWSGEPVPEGLPTAGRILDEMTAGGIDGRRYDDEWPQRARGTMW